MGFLKSSWGNRSFCRKCHFQEIFNISKECKIHILTWLYNEVTDLLFILCHIHMLLVLVEFSSMECQVHRMYLVLFILLSGSFQVNKFKKKIIFFSWFWNGCIWFLVTQRAWYITVPSNTVLEYDIGN